MSILDAMMYNRIVKSIEGIRLTMDGLMLYASVQECAVLIGGKIEKIYQPECDELMISIHNGNKNYKLLLSANPNNGRIQLTKSQRNNPANPPVFCMMLRKYISGGRILSLEQPALDRIVMIQVGAENQLGDNAVFTLIIEVMGKHSNILLVDQTGVILDAIKHVGLQTSSVRQVLPGLKYCIPPQQQKRDPREAKANDFLHTLAQNGRLDRLLSNEFFGLAPSVGLSLLEKLTDKIYAQELSENEKIDISEQLVRFYKSISNGQFVPTVLLSSTGDTIGILPFSPMLPDSYMKKYDSVSEALDEYYSVRDYTERIRQKSAAILHVLRNNLERCYKKLQLQNDILMQKDEAEKYRLFGELLIANVYRLNKGPSAVVEDYYAVPPKQVEIPLDETLSVTDNAQKYYKKYNKLKQAQSMAEKQRLETLTEIDYLEGQVDNLSKCTDESELLELKEELVELKYIRAHRKGGKQQKIPQSKPMRFMSQDGFEIYIGKNNQQNDTITLKMAKGEDIWLHTKEIPGSHVIIKTKGEPVPNSTISQAAQLAAFYSKARASAGVPVDYTFRKYIKKPAGARPGMVIYTTNKTAYVTPDEIMVKSIKKMQ